MSLKDILTKPKQDFVPEYTHPWLPTQALPVDGERIYIRSTAITGLARSWNLIPFVVTSPVPCDHVSSCCPSCIWSWHQHWDIRLND